MLNYSFYKTKATGLKFEHFVAIVSLTYISHIYSNLKKFCFYFILLPAWSHASSVFSLCKESQILSSLGSRNMDGINHPLRTLQMLILLYADYFH